MTSVSNLDDHKKYLLTQLIQEHVIQTGKLLNIDQLKALGLSPSELINYLKIIPRGCKNLSNNNTLEYLKMLKKNFPDLEILNMSGCMITLDIINFLKTTKIKIVYYDSTYFYNLLGLSVLGWPDIENLLKKSGINFIDSDWSFYYKGFALSLSEDDLDEEELDKISLRSGLNKYTIFTNEQLEKFIISSLKKGFDPQCGLDGLLNSYIFGSRTSFHDVEPPNDDFAINIIKKLLKAGAKLRLGIVVPSLGYYNLNEDSDYFNIEDISPNIEIQANILKLFFKMDPKYYKQSILPNIYKYLPKDWKSLKSESWQDNEEIDNEPLTQLIYQEFKYYLDQPILVQNKSGFWEKKYIII